MGERRPLEDLREEALEVLRAVAAQGLTLRATGGIAVALRCPSAGRPPLARRYKDLDFVGRSDERREVDALLVELGYDPSREFNVLHGRHRLLYWDAANGRQLDVFLDRVVMCHALELKDRLALDELTLPAADLLLTKLQVVQTNERDLKDAIALLLDAEPDADRIAHVLAEDWGWWRTVTEVLGRIEIYAAALPGFELAGTIAERVRALRDRIDAEPKSLRWKARARVGDRLRWYELPEEEGQ